MKYLLMTVCILSLLVCSQSFATDRSSPQKRVEIPERTIEDWSIEKAKIEANIDIQKDKLKIYYSGTIFASPTGVKQEDMRIIKDLPIAYAGVGCVISNLKLREAQVQYAKKYNEIIISHLENAK